MKKAILLIISQLLLVVVLHAQEKENHGRNLQDINSIGFGISEFDTLSIRLFPDYMSYFVPGVSESLKQFGIKGSKFYSDLFVPKRYRPGTYDVFVELKLLDQDGEIVFISSAKTVSGFGP